MFLKCFFFFRKLCDNHISGNETIETENALIQFKRKNILIKFVIDEELQKYQDEFSHLMKRSRKNSVERLLLENDSKKHKDDGKVENLQEILNESFTHITRGRKQWFEESIDKPFVEETNTLKKRQFRHKNSQKYSKQILLRRCKNRIRKLPKTLGNMKDPVSLKTSQTIKKHNLVKHTDRKYEDIVNFPKREHKTPTSTKKQLLIHLNRSTLYESSNILERSNLTEKIETSNPITNSIEQPSKKSNQPELRIIINKLKIETKDKFRCQHCPFVTTWRSYLRKHNLLHRNTDDTNLFKCNNCSYKSKYKSYLKDHMLVHQTFVGEKKFKCLHCPYTAYLKRHLRKHKNRVHSSIIYKCKQCPFKSKYRDHLSRHVVIHKDLNEVEILRCQDCNYTSRYKLNLKLHVLVHRKYEGSERFRCNVCNYRTNYKSNLNRHVLVHKSFDEVQVYRCRKCDFFTKYKTTLERHSTVMHKK